MLPRASHDYAESYRTRARRCSARNSHSYPNLGCRGPTDLFDLSYAGRCLLRALWQVKKIELGPRASKSIDVFGSAARPALPRVGRKQLCIYLCDGLASGRMLPEARDQVGRESKPQRARRACMQPWTKRKGYAVVLIRIAPIACSRTPIKVRDRIRFCRREYQRRYSRRPLRRDGRLSFRQFYPGIATTAADGTGSRAVSQLA